MKRVGKLLRPSAQIQPTGWCFKAGVRLQTYFEKNILILCLDKILICFQSSDLNRTEHAFHLLRTELKARRKTNKQQLKAAALKTCEASQGRKLW